MWWRAPWLQQRWTLLGLALCDASLLIGTYNLLFWHRFDRWAGVTGSVVAVVTIWLGTSYLLGRYSRPEGTWKRNTYSRLVETTITTAVVLFAVVVIAGWGLGSKDPRAFRSFIVPILAVSFTGSSAAQEITHRKKRSKKSWRVIVSESEQNVLLRELRCDPPAQRMSIQMASASNTHEIKSERNGSTLGFAISDEAATSDELIEALLGQKSQGAEVSSITTWCEGYLQRIPPELFSSRWLAQADGFDLQPGRVNWRIKRFGDLFLGCALLIATAPLVAIACLAILLEDQGPVLYSQVRTGLYGKEFRIWKLRSMRVNAESQGVQWSKHGDERITRVGHLLRKLRIDELPQLISVIKGEMSLIGPRPERPDIERVLENQIPHYRVRHWVRPGLSGWAQVCYPYGASLEDSRAKLSYDLYYLRNASLGLDILILLKTIRLVASARGAIAKHPVQSK